MKASELIAQLQREISEVGDQDVFIHFMHVDPEKLTDAGFPTGCRNQYNRLDADPVIVIRCQESKNIKKK